MPCFKLFTNLSRSKIPEDFVDRAIVVIAEALSKDPKNCFCSISSDTQISFGGDSKTPCIIASLESIGNLGQDENVLISKRLSDFIEKEIGVSPSRCFISFYDMAPWNIARHGTTASQFDKKLNS